jgi:hypothetical protein
MPVVLAIDVEPDDPEFAPRRHAPWAGFLSCLELFSEIRERLGRATDLPVHLTWFLRMDPQITVGYGSPAWAAETYSAQIDLLRDAGDEIGLHTHAWRLDRARQGWVADVADESWVEHCARSSFAAYRAAFGTPCRAHRAGDRFMSNGLLTTLRSLGVEVDLTPEPGMRGSAPGRSGPYTAAIPDMAGVPRLPYFPSRADWRQPAPTTHADDDLLMIPLTAADPGPLLGRWRAAARRVRNVRRPLHRPLLPWAPGIGVHIWDLVLADVKAGRLNTLAFALRSHGALDRGARSALLESIAALERHELMQTLAFMTASEARDRLVMRSSTERPG